jgi:peptidoglycan L-alanyl-D-glutamate endopeptidase CwlK
VSATAVLTLVMVLASTLLLLAWVGWRFFLMTPKPLLFAQPSAERTLPGRWPWWREKTSSLGRALTLLNHRIVWLSLVLVAASIFGVLALAGRFALDPLHAFSFDHQQHINLALNPEKLVPPPPLPPSLFVSVDRPALETADRDWSKLDPRFMQTVLQLFDQLKARGYNLVLLEGYRSPERQDMLANLGTHVTNARGLQSRHQLGLAADIAFMKDGRLVISERDPWAFAAYQALGEEAEALGLVWGGRWTFKDYGHVEMSRATHTRG